MRQIRSYYSRTLLPLLDSIRLDAETTRLGSRFRYSRGSQHSGLIRFRTVRYEQSSLR